MVDVGATGRAPYQCPAEYDALRTRAIVTIEPAYPYASQRAAAAETLTGGSERRRCDRPGHGNTLLR